jgi:hypothetical protein
MGAACCRAAEAALGVNVTEQYQKLRTAALDELLGPR